MGSIFVGLLFLYLDFHITISDQYIIGFMPTFVGYLLIRSGVMNLEEENSVFIDDKSKMGIIFMLAYSVVMYVFDLLGVSVGISRETIPSLIFSLVDITSMFVELKVIIGIIDMLREVEIIRNLDLMTNKLRDTYMRAFIVSIVFLVVLLVPVLNIVLIIPAALITCIFNIIFVTNFYIAKKRYVEW